MIGASGHELPGGQPLTDRHSTLVLGLAVLCTLAAATREAFGFAAPFETEGTFNASEPGQAGMRDVITYHDEKGQRSITIPDLEGFYRFSDDMEIDVSVPFVVGSESGGTGTTYALGSVALEFDWRLFKPGKDSWLPKIGIAPEIDLPSGAPRFGIGTGYVHAYLPLIFEESVGGWSLVQNVAAGINPGAGNRNYAFVGASASHPVTDSLSLGGELYYQGSESRGLKDQVSFTVGGKYEFGNHERVYFGIGRGIVNGDNANRLSTYLAYQKLF
jgi:hypothetical protein